MLVFPALTLNYLGQGSLVLQDPSSVSSPFFLLFPDWSHIPMVILATIATVIASRGGDLRCFLGDQTGDPAGVILPASKWIGQIYMPAVNWALFFAVVILVVGFGSSAALASAYGIAVVGTLTIDAILFLVVVRKLWQKPLWMAICFGVVFLTIDFTFLAANPTKVEHGGWFPALDRPDHPDRDPDLGSRLPGDRGKAGRAGRFAHRTGGRDQPQGSGADPGPGHRRLSERPNQHRSAGLPLGLPERDGIVHDHVVVLSWSPPASPMSRDKDRIVIDDLGYDYDGISHITATVGFMDVPDVPYLLELANPRSPTARSISARPTTTSPTF